MVPVNLPLLAGNEKKYLLECIESGWISSEGPFIAQFEKQFATKMNRTYGIAVSSGTAALDIAIEALEIGAGDEVIVPTFTIISCIHQILRKGAVPIFVDCDPHTWNMDVTQIEQKISPQTKAILVVHIYGLPTHLRPILDLAQKYQLKVIEDAAEAHGLTYEGKPCGSFGDLSIFSFYPNKHVTTGEGGMLLTHSETLANRCRSLRNLCFQEKRRFVHEELGWNYRMTNLQAALGLAQLETLDQTVQRKKQIGKLYTELLKNTPELQLPVASTAYAENIYWVFGIVLKDFVNTEVEIITRELAEINIGTRPFFWPLHLQPVLKKYGLHKIESLPVAEKIAQRGFYLPSGTATSDEQIHFVVQQLKAVLKKNLNRAEKMT